MFLDLLPGNLAEPMTGREWDRPTIIDQVGGRIGHFMARGMKTGDRVLFLHGNTIEFFVDLLAVWSLRECVIPVDSRLTPYEVEKLAGAALPHSPGKSRGGQAEPGGMAIGG